MAGLCHRDCIEKGWLAPKKPQVGPLTPPGSGLTSGLLERPVLPPPVAIDTASYKIFVSGKSGVGKTALVAKLAGLEVPVVHHETTGESLLGGLPWGGEKTRPGPHELESVTSPTCYSATPEPLHPLSLHKRLCASPWDCGVASTRAGFPCGSDGRESACNAGDLGSIPGVGRSPGGGHGNILHYSCLENPVDRGAWQATVYRVAESGMTAVT